MFALVVSVHYKRLVLNVLLLIFAGCIQAPEGSHYLCYAHDHAKHGICLSEAER